MGQRLRAKNQKRNRDLNSEYKKSPAPRAHKIDRERSRKARFKNSNRSY